MILMTQTEVGMVLKGGLREAILSMVDRKAVSSVEQAIIEFNKSIDNKCANRCLIPLCHGMRCRLKDYNKECNP